MAPAPASGTEAVRPVAPAQNPAALRAFVQETAQRLRMTPQEVHDLGLAEVARIEAEMKAILLAQAELRPQESVAQALARLSKSPRFLYPNGDPRAKLLLAAARDAWPSNKRWLPIDGTIAAARRRTDAAPNIDFVLAAIGHLTGMDDDAGERIFALARTAGWLAHAFEEYGERPLRFRPRAVFRDV